MRDDDVAWVAAGCLILLIFHPGLAALLLIAWLIYRAGRAIFKR